MGNDVQSLVDMYHEFQSIVRFVLNGICHKYHDSSPSEAGIKVLVKCMHGLRRSAICRRISRVSVNHRFVYQRNLSHISRFQLIVDMHHKYVWRHDIATRTRDSGAQNTDFTCRVSLSRGSEVILELKYGYFR